MKCAKCPLYKSWSNESDSGESCEIFGDSWDSYLQYEDKNGNIVGCYVDHCFIKKVEQEHENYLAEEAAFLEEWILKKEQMQEILWEVEDARSSENNTPS